MAVTEEGVDLPTKTRGLQIRLECNLVIATTTIREASI
jgi:hypothetical protein